MPSFDAACKPNLVEVRNALDQVAKEISTRFDFKGSSAQVELKDKTITALADSEFQLRQVTDVINNKCSKRGIDLRFFDVKKSEKIGGDKVKQETTIRDGIETEVAKKIVKLIKDSKIKVQASIQGDVVRVTGAKRDDLQATIALLKRDVEDVPLSFDNFRD